VRVFVGRGEVGGLKGSSVSNRAVVVTHGLRLGCGPVACPVGAGRGIPPRGVEPRRATGGGYAIPSDAKKGRCSLTLPRFISKTTH
jgi:hypothetical protein